jgi:hypothetical protein
MQAFFSFPSFIKKTKSRVHFFFIPFHTTFERKKTTSSIFPTMTPVRVHCSSIYYSAMHAQHDLKETERGPPHVG